MLEINKIYNEDCIGEKGMCLISDKSIDMILCDLPYGTTKNKWDCIIDLKKIWKEYERIIKDNGVIALFGQSPFDKVLACSNLKLFKYEWIWEKDQGTGHLNAKKMPLKIHENILVFYKKLPTYNPQMWVSKPMHTVAQYSLTESSNYNKVKQNNGLIKDKRTIRYPVDVIKFNKVNNYSKDKTNHPTQKPTELIEYFIKTYSNEGELILDNCIGSGSTAIAAINTNRNYIGFETSKEYYDIANKRIELIK